MGSKEEHFEFFGFNKVIEVNEVIATKIFGYSESLCSTNTYQFDDYSKYVADIFNLKEKAKIHEEVFPQDSKKAFKMGAGLVKRQSSEASD